jgi:hypothetical protein
VNATPTFLTTAALTTSISLNRTSSHLGDFLRWENSFAAKVGALIAFCGYFSDLVCLLNNRG